jgi:hypothetical protein
MVDRLGSTPEAKVGADAPVNGFHQRADEGIQRSRKLCAISAEHQQRAGVLLQQAAARRLARAAGAERTTSLAGQAATISPHFRGRAR